MKTNYTNLPIFPLSVFLLPEGMTKLRIFEPRYLKMVSIASKGQGFVIWAKGDNKSISDSPWGSWVEIINFDKAEDGCWDCYWDESIPLTSNTVPCSTKLDVEWEDESI